MLRSTYLMYNGNFHYQFEGVAMGSPVYVEINLLNVQREFPLSI